jgi:hypothetical protein
MDTIFPASCFHGLNATIERREIAPRYPTLPIGKKNL